MTLRHKGVNEQGAPGLIVQGPLVRVILGPHPEDAKNTQAAGGTIRTTEGHLLVNTGAQLTVVETP